MVSNSLVNWFGYAWIGLLFTIVSICALIYGLFNRYKFVKAFVDIPGPAAIPIFGNAFQLTGSQAEFFQLLIKYSKSHDGMFRLWIGQKPFVFIHKAEAVQPLLSSSLHIDKSLEYKLLHELLGNGLVTGTGPRWHLHRKLLTPVFHYSILEEYLQPARRCSEILVNRLTKQINPVSFNIVPFAKAMALDFICEITMGYQLNSQLNSNLDYVHAIEELMSIAQRRFITPWLKPDSLFKLSSYYRRHHKSLEVVTSFSSKIIRDRKRKYAENQSISTDENKNLTNGKDQTFLDLLLAASENGSLLNDNDIQEEVNTFIFAGHDTTATTVSWALYMLGLHPEMQDKIIEELNKELPQFGSNRLTVSDLSKLNYLECCIKETLRLYPAVPIIARHLTTPINILGCDLPTGTTVLVNTYSLHRDAKYFPEPNAFIPERFSHDSSKPDRHPFSYIPFSAGLRNCIGQKLAMMTVKIIIATILKEFRVKAIVPEEELKLVAEVVLINENGIRIAIEHRN